MRRWKSSGPWEPETPNHCVDDPYRALIEALLPAIVHPGYPHRIMHYAKQLSRCSRWIAGSSLLLLAQLAAAAPPPMVPPQPGANKNTPAVWIGMLLMLILVAIILSISLMPSRRGHQD